MIFIQILLGMVVALSFLFVVVNQVRFWRGAIYDLDERQYLCLIALSTALIGLAVTLP